MTKLRRYRRTPEHEIAVRDLISCGVSFPQIAKQLGISERTIRRYYGDITKELGIKCGAKPYKPSDFERSLVKKMAAVGITQPEISGLLSISIPTLVKNFRHELTVGMIEANLQVGTNLFKMATGPIDSKTTVAAAIWWTKARMGWKDTSRVENTGADGGPIQNEHQIVVVLPDNGRGDGPPAIDGPDDIEVEATELLQTTPPNDADDGTDDC